MVTSVWVDKIIVATLAKRMDLELKFLQNIEQWERQFQSWKCGGRPLGCITKTFFGSDGWFCLCWTKGVYTSVHKLVLLECDVWIDKS